VFRHLDDWGTLKSESDAMTSVVAPILQEFLRVPGQIKFKGYAHINCHKKVIGINKSCGKPTNSATITTVKNYFYY
jgi:hypothetical protein